MAYTSEAKGRELTTVIREALNAFDVVGAAAAIVHHDAVLISDGLGVRDLDSGMAADQDTLYQMGRKTPGFSRGDISPLAREGQHVPPSAGQFVARMWPPAGLGIRMMAAIDHMCANKGGDERHGHPARLSVPAGPLARGGPAAHHVCGARPLRLESGTGPESASPRAGGALAGVRRLGGDVPVLERHP